MSHNFKLSHYHTLIKSKFTDEIEEKLSNSRINVDKNFRGSRWKKLLSSETKCYFIPITLSSN